MVGSNTPMPRRFRFAAIFALLALSVVGLAACGGGSSSDADAQSLLKATFGPDHSVKSGKLDVALNLDAKGIKTLTGPISLKLSGPFQTTGKGKLPQVDLALELTGAGTSFSAGAVSTGDKGFLELQGQAFAVDDATFAKFKTGYEQAAAKSGSSSGNPSLASLGVDPLRWLKDPKVAGTEQAGGADSYHITAGVDVSAFLDDVSTLLGKAGSLSKGTNVPSSLSDQQRKDIEASITDAKLDLWTGKDDKTLRRLKLDIGIDVPQAIRSRAGGLAGGRLTFDLTINALNEDQTITAPKNARPLADLKTLIAGGATGATGTTAPATPAPSASGQSSKYLTCLSKAGSDVAKIQQCATLVGQ